MDERHRPAIGGARGVRVLEGFAELGADVEHEIDLAGAVTLRLHSGCFMIWQEVLEKRKISGGSGGVWPPFYAARVVAHEALLTTCADVRATAAQIRAVSRSVRAHRHFSPAA